MVKGKKKKRSKSFCSSLTSRVESWVWTLILELWVQRLHQTSGIGFLYWTSLENGEMVLFWISALTTKPDGWHRWNLFSYSKPCCPVMSSLHYFTASLLQVLMRKTTIQLQPANSINSITISKWLNTNRISLLWRFSFSASFSLS